MAVKTKSAGTRDPSLHALPPRSIEAEESILSAILINNDTLFDVVEILAPEDFYRKSHQEIYAGICELFKRNEPIDLVTLTTALKEDGRLEEVGGAAYVAGLMDTAPVAANARHYARIIHDKACLRQLIKKTHDISVACFEDRGDVDEVIDMAETAIFEISERKIKPAFYPIHRIIDDNIDALEERQGNKTLITGIPTGFSKLDELTSGLQNSDLIILAGRPAMGKTAFALNIARNVAVNENIPVAVFSLEMAKEQLSLRLLCSEARIDSNRLRSGFFSKDDWSRVTEAAGTMSGAPIYIDDSPDISSMEIRAKSRRLKMEVDLGLIIIDYIQLMKGRSLAERRDLEISEMSRSLKILAKELNVPVVALSQLNRKLEERVDKRPQLSDLRESGALEQDADVVAFIFRDEVYNPSEDNPNKGTAEILLRKQRNGPTGEARLKFFGAYTRFENLSEGYEAGGTS
ncbi:Replicative DNA helicase [Candidatus Desulfarcum epimagneticum]|uniref:Replicative DNA helicase n=1 Tax=uncultured Desulfobacteraceae bacterium TaxID=218296 RepID=A0A484HHJ4_9BACT|nr:Replicative DNA helicase [uncultured Desulfobacteraceae bacterium]